MGSQNKTKRNEMIKAYKRQKGKCWICGDQMLLNVGAENPKRATADHVVPKSLGGRVKGNIKAAHRICNIKRGNGETQ